MVNCPQNRIIGTKRPERERAEHEPAQLAQRFVPLNELVELVAAIRAHDRIGCRHAGDQPVPAKGGCDRGCETGVAFTGSQKRLAELEMIACHPIENVSLFQAALLSADFGLATGAADQLTKHVDRKIGDRCLPFDDESGQRGVVTLGCQASYLACMQNAGVPGDDAIATGMNCFPPLVGNVGHTQNVEAGDQALEVLQFCPLWGLTRLFSEYRPLNKCNHSRPDGSHGIPAQQIDYLHVCAELFGSPIGLANAWLGKEDHSSQEAGCETQGEGLRSGRSRFAQRHPEDGVVHRNECYVRLLPSRPGRPNAVLE